MDPPFLLPFAHWEKFCPDFSGPLLALDENSSVITSSAKNDGTIVRWRIAKFATTADYVVEPICVMIGHNSPITYLGFVSVSSEQPGFDLAIISGAFDGNICLWGFEDGKCLLTTRVCQSAINDISLSFCGKYGIVSTKSTFIYVISISNLEVLFKIDFPFDWVFSTYFIPSDFNTKLSFVVVSQQGYLYSTSFDIQAEQFKSIDFSPLSLENHLQQLIKVFAVMDANGTKWIIVLSRNACQISTTHNLHNSTVISAETEDTFQDCLFILPNYLMVIFTLSGKLLLYKIVVKVNNNQNMMEITHSTAEFASQELKHPFDRMFVLQRPGRNLGTFIGFFGKHHLDNSILHLYELTQCHDDCRKNDCRSPSRYKLTLLNTSYPCFVGNSRENSVNPVTISMYISDKYLIRGFSDGTILKLSHSSFISHLNNRNNNSENVSKLPGVHSAPISFLFIPSVKSKAILISADTLGLVAFWEFKNAMLYKKLHLCKAPVVDIIQYQEFSSQIVYIVYSSGEIAQVSILDNISSSNDIIRVDFIFPKKFGRDLYSISWKVKGNFVLISYDENEYLEIYHKGYLDREISGKESCLPIIYSSDFMYIVNFKSAISTSQKNKILNVLTVSPDKLDIPLEVVLIDIKQLLYELSTNSPKPEFLKELFGHLHTWGLDADLDNILKGKLQINQPSKNVILGNLTEDGQYLSFCFKDPWNASPTYTSSRLLAILALLKFLFVPLKLESDLIIFITFYGSLLRERLGESVFIRPGLNFLISHWQSPSVNLQQAARVLISTTVKDFNEQSCTSYIDYWMLPTLDELRDKLTYKQAKSIIHLGIFSLSKPSYLDQSLKKSIARGLALILSLKDNNSKLKLVASEVISRNIVIWESFINVVAIMQLLMNWWTRTDSNQTHVLNVILESLLCLFEHSKDTCVKFMLNYFDKGIPEKITSLKLIDALIHKESNAFSAFLPKILETVIKSLDPGNLSQREILSPHFTTILCNLVHFYSKIAFHKDTQRLAVASDNNILIYDVKTCTKSFVLEGHTCEITTVSFSNDGKTIVSYSIEEAAVRFWQPSGGLFALLVNSSCKSFKVSQATRDFTQMCRNYLLKNASTENDGIRFRWIASNCVELIIPNQLKWTIRI